MLRALERHYARELVVIGVHSAKFPTERQGPGLRLALRRLRISHPVVNDPTFRLWRAYAVRAWPTLIFIDPEGRVIGRHEGEIPQPVLDRLLAEMVREFSARGLLRPEPLPWQQAQEERLGGLLAFPGKVLADAAADRLYIADTGHHRIIIARLDGQVLQIVGQGEPGWLDGPAATCRFQSPEGLALGEGGLFIADTENHLIRRLDLASGIVTTVAGTGEQALRWSAGGPARQTPLSSPWDLAWHQGALYIAMAGLHQLWRLEPGGLTLTAWAGTGGEGLHDGHRTEAWFAQPSGLAVAGDRLYVADSESSAIREVDLASGQVRTIVGTGLFDFGDVDGVGEAARLQHPLGVTAVHDLLYVADTYNHKIKRLSPRTRMVMTVAGSGEPGRDDGTGPVARFFEPGGLSAAAGALYIADTNNHAIRRLDLATARVTTVAVRLP